ncbi:E3 ubiquitin/ISG15 ligase TRIM25-like isoform X2 [Xyrauchen texanus]|uniref:E3 ubiquitin/ISG15 ligase TRIM25-like isoform X2 n=1 Tax=Xyrauchen texanus TaxID=154827 RepID=UPI002241C357|nr:E3 ubiquitin/ISG15 ligase TRIM25-like isoform X2 [Xyrauchen texanus]
MAEDHIAWDQGQFRCSICLNLLKDPVAIPCGHSYCIRCITDYWDHEDQRRVYSCPRCRQTFTPRPVLGKNAMLAEVLEKLKKTKLKAALPTECYDGPENVECDVCTGRKHKAVKSCLVCLNSYCQNHLEQHENFFKNKRHNLMDASRRLQEMICPQHDKLLDSFCYTDQQCICYACTMDQHKNHKTVPAAAERTKKQAHLEETQKKFRQTIQERQKELQELRETVESHKRSAQEAVKESERIFTELIRSFKRSRSEVTKLIRDQEKAAVGRAEGLLERLEQEIADLRRRDAKLEELLHTEDHVYFLQSYQSVSVTRRFTNSSNIIISSPLSFDDVRKSVSHLKEQIEKITGKVTRIKMIPNIDHKTRQAFLQRYRVIAYTDTIQPYPDHPDRFDRWEQVLCRESVWGHCYWEVEWRGNEVDISVSYNSISRKGRSNESRLGNNNQSWSLYCSGSGYNCSFWHNNKETTLPLDSSSCRIGVYVDHSAGTLSFYSVSDTMTLIHRVHTTFTQPLYPGFWVDEGSEIKLCDLTQPMIQRS